MFMERLGQLREKMADHAKLNRIRHVGQIAPMIIKILSSISKAESSIGIRVIDTNALFCYAAIAGVRIEYSNFDNQTDVLQTVNKRIVLGADERLEHSYLLSILKAVDSSFKLKRSSKISSFVAKDGLQVDLVLSSRGRGHGRVTYNDENFWNTEKKDLDWLLRAPPVETIVVGSNGAAAQAKTVDPRAFILFNQFMAQQTNYTPMERHQSAAKMLVALDLIERCLPNFTFDELAVTPLNLREAISSFSIAACFPERSVLLLNASANRLKATG
jgi:hypothetical protein